MIIFSKGLVSGTTLASTAVSMTYWEPSSFLIHMSKMLLQVILLLPLFTWDRSVTTPNNTMITLWYIIHTLLSVFQGLMKSCRSRTMCKTLAFISRFRVALSIISDVYNSYLYFQVWQGPVDPGHRKCILCTPLQLLAAVTDSCQWCQCHFESHHA